MELHEESGPWAAAARRRRPAVRGLGPCHDFFGVGLVAPQRPPELEHARRVVVERDEPAVTPQAVDREPHGHDLEPAGEGAAVAPGEGSKLPAVVAQEGEKDLVREVLGKVGTAASRRVARKRTIASRTTAPNVATRRSTLLGAPAR